MLLLVAKWPPVWDRTVYSDYCDFLELYQSACVLLSLLVLRVGYFELIKLSDWSRGGRVLRGCWVNCQCRSILLLWIIVGQGLIAFAVDAGGGCLVLFFFDFHFSLLSPSHWGTARYRLKYCLKGPLNPKQPTNHLSDPLIIYWILRVITM